MDATLFLADLEAKPASLRALADALAHGNPWREQVTLQPPVLLCVPTLKQEVVPADVATWGKVKAMYR